MAATSLRDPQPPRGTAYCVDCYADGGRVTVACGCGNSVKNRWPFIKGHDKGADTKPAAAPRQQTNGAPVTPPVSSSNGNGHSKISSDGAYMVPCEVSEWAMDRIWIRLTPEEKAQLLFGQGWRNHSRAPETMAPPLGGQRESA